MKVNVAIVGAGVFGASAALAFRRRGLSVALCDPGPLPHPLAASTDISKVVRMDYGADALYTSLMERALDGWRAWNRAWPEPLFHETGLLFLSRGAMAPGGFEHDSFELLSRRGHRLERLDPAALRARFPAWRAERYPDGYYNPSGGWAESGRVVSRLLDEARAAGAALLEGARFTSLLERGDRVVGARFAGAEAIEARHVVVAAGSWTPTALPRLASAFRTVGQPVFHLRPRDPARWRGAGFPVFGADIARTGYYGFPANADGLVKIANHGAGRPMHPESPERAVTAEERAALEAFLEDTFPDLAGAPLAATRVCVYCDTLDEHFWIALDPERPGLTVAAGGSGHAFKFAPLLGDLIADATLGVDDPSLARFRYRLPAQGEPPPRGEEAARSHGDGR